MPTTNQRTCLTLLSAAVVLAAGVACGQTAVDTPPPLPNWQAVDHPEIALQFPSAAAPSAHAPAPERVYRPALPLVSPSASPATRSADASEMPKQVQNVIDFYGGRTSQRALAQLPNRPSSGAARPATPRQVRKPYEGAADAPTLSPYLNLFRDENNDYLPNYHAYVRPMVTQQASNQHQRQELAQLRRQVHTAAVSPPVGNPGGSVSPTSGYGSRFMNTGQFYKSANSLR